MAHGVQTSAIIVIRISRAGFYWWGPGPTLRMDHHISGSSKRSTNWANQYDIYFGGPLLVGARGHAPLDTPKSGSD